MSICCSGYRTGSFQSCLSLLTNDYRVYIPALRHIWPFIAATARFLVYWQDYIGTLNMFEIHLEQIVRQYM